METIHERLVNNGWREIGITRACAFYVKKGWIAVWFNYSGKLRLYRRNLFATPD